MAQVHAEHGVAGLQQREINRDIGRRAGMRLHIGMARAEQPRRALDGKRLNLVSVSLAAVVAPARIPFRVFVVEHRAHGFHHRGRDIVLGRNEFHALALALHLAGDGRVNVGVGLFQRIVNRHESGSGGGIKEARYYGKNDGDGR